MPGAYFYVREDEEVLARLAPPLSFAVVLALVPVLVLSVLAVAIAVLVPRFTDFEVDNARVLSAWAILVAILAFAAWRRAATTEYALTDSRIYARTGRLVTRLHFTTHDKITDIRFRQGPLERAFGLSSITFATAGGEVHVAGVRDAMALKGAAESARDAFIQRLLAQAPALAPAPATGIGPAPDSQIPAPLPRAAPPPAVAFQGPLPGYLQPGEVPVWSARPQLVAALGALRSVLGIVPVLLFSNFMDGSRRLWIPLAALGLVLMFIAVRFMQLRRTEYVATERRVYSRHGLVGTTVSQLTYDKITDVAYHQDLIGRLFGYGTVTLQTAGGSQAPITMVGLAKPLDAKQTVEGWRDAAVGSARV